MFTRSYSLVSTGNAVEISRITPGLDLTSRRVQEGSGAKMHRRPGPGGPGRPALQWLTVCLQRVYHKYGLKHIILLLILVAYAFAGALVFLLIEKPEEFRLKNAWRDTLESNRTKFIDDLAVQLFNNSRFLIFLRDWQMNGVKWHLNSRMQEFENQLGVTFDPQHKIPWDYWNAVLFCGTICTTIGYGHIFPRTSFGRVLTCVYALFGIPLVLTVLNDMGKLLTVGMKYPWFQCKRAAKRVARLCTHEPMEKILIIEKRERENLSIFDLPIPVAVGLIVGWIFLCSATFLMWEKRWSYLEAFYFFFISLSTVGLGDITPDQPKYLLMMFGYIIVGLSLVSMSVNLIQTKLEKTYHGGAALKQRPTSIEFAEETMDGDEFAGQTTLQSPGFRATLGVLQSTTRAADYDSPTSRLFAQQASKKSRACQTQISFPVIRTAVISRGERSRGASLRFFLMPKKQRSMCDLFQTNLVHETVAQSYGVHRLANDAAVIFLAEGAGRRGLLAGGHCGQLVRTVSNAGPAEKVIELDANSNENLHASDPCIVGS